MLSFASPFKKVKGATLRLEERLLSAEKFVWGKQVLQVTLSWKLYHHEFHHRRKLSFIPNEATLCRPQQRSPTQQGYHSAYRRLNVTLVLVLVSLGSRWWRSGSEVDHSSHAIND